MVQVTIGETFDDSVYGENPIPREYAFNPVDYRVDIYSKYSDDNYKDFIKEGKNIHDKFNKKNYCNSKNEKLLYHTDNCTIEGKEHAHGGYRCKSDKNEWNNEDCQAYYCDIGYYYNQFYQRCIEECSFEDTKNYLIIDDMQDKKYEIEKNKITTFSFINELSDNYYFYNSSKNLVYDLPKIGFIKKNTLFLNKDKTAEDNFEITITKLITDIQLLTYKVRSFESNQILLFKNKEIMLLQVSEDHIFYGYNTFNSNLNQLKYAKYNEEMSLEDILEGNDKYFEQYTNNNALIYLPKDEVNILFMNYTQLDIIHYFISKKNIGENINIIDTNTNFLFLEKNKIYELDFKDNKINRMIKLSRKTNNSQIIIEDENENITLNSENIYYKIKEGFKGKIKLEVKNSDAIIEFLFKLSNINILNFRDGTTLNTTSKFSLITVSKEYFSKYLIFKLQGGEKFSFKMFFGYAKPPYSYYYFSNTNIFTPSIKEINLNILVEDTKIMDGEYYCVLFENLGSYLHLKMSKKEDDDSDNDPENKGNNTQGKDLETWKISLIIVGSILALIILIVIVIYSLRKRSHIKNSQIEEKMENLTTIK